MPRSARHGAVFHKRVGVIHSILVIILILFLRIAFHLHADAIM